MTLNNDIHKAYKKNQIIATCCVGYEKYMNGETPYLPIRFNNEWIYDHVPPVKEYKQYSHGFAPEVFDELMEQLKLKKEFKRNELSDLIIH